MKLTVLSKAGNVVKTVSKELVSKETGKLAATVLGGVAIGVTATKLGTKKQNKLFGGKTVVMNNSKIAALGAGMGTAVTAVIAVKNAIPKVVEATKTVSEMID